MNAKKFLKDKNNWTTLIVLVFACVGFGISFRFEQFSFQVIAGMFVLVAFERVLAQYAYMTDIKAKLNILTVLNDKLKLDTRNSSQVELKRRDECKNHKQSIDEAKHSLFISGVNLNSLGGLENAIALRSDLNIRILVLKVDDGNLLEIFEEMLGRKLSGSPTAYFFLKHLLECKNIEIREIDSIMPVTFVATDIDKPYGYIRARHYFNCAGGKGNSPTIELTPDNDKWYEVYRLQIETVWNRGKSWVPREKWTHPK